MVTETGDYAIYCSIGGGTPAGGCPVCGVSKLSKNQCGNLRAWHCLGMIMGAQKREDFCAQYRAAGAKYLQELESK